jgi:hypothetical protein
LSKLNFVKSDRLYRKSVVFIKVGMFWYDQTLQNLTHAKLCATKIGTEGVFDGVIVGQLFFFQVGQLLFFKDVVGQLLS